MKSLNIKAEYYIKINEWNKESKEFNPKLLQSAEGKAIEDFIYTAIELTAKSHLTEIQNKEVKDLYTDKNEIPSKKLIKILEECKESKKENQRTMSRSL